VALLVANQTVKMHMTNAASLHVYMLPG